MFQPMCGPSIGPRLQPNSMLNRVCTLLEHMRDTHDWRFSLNKDFNYEGGLTPCLNKLIRDRKKEVGHSYGIGANRSIMENVSNVNQLDWSVFDERDPIHHAQKVMGYFETNFGFRGGEEHMKLERKHIERGVFPPGHEWAGKEFWGIQNMPDKTNKLSSTNTIL